MASITLTNQEFSVFKKLAHYIVFLQHPKDNIETIQVRELHEYVGSLVNLGASTVRNKYSESEPILKKDNFDFFISAFLDEFLSNKTQTASSKIEILILFEDWVKRTCKRQGWNIPEEVRLGEAYVANINRNDNSFYKDDYRAHAASNTKENFNVLATYLVEAYVAITKVVKTALSEENMRKYDVLWNVFSATFKERYWKSDFEKFKKQSALPMKNLHVFNFDAPKANVIAFDVYLELNVFDHMSYSSYFQSLAEQNDESEIEHHVTRIIELLRIEIDKRIDKGLNHEVAQWFFRDEVDGPLNISIETVFSLLGIDRKNIHEILPLTKLAYIKTYGFGSCIYQDGSWLLSNFTVHRSSTVSPYTYPQFFIPIEQMDSLKSIIDKYSENQFGK